MKKIYFTLAIILLISAVSSAQRGRDLLYLRNGSVINCKLVETTDESYTVRTSDGSVYVYPLSEVERITIGEGITERRERGLFGLGLEAGFLAGPQSSEYVAPLGFNIFGIMYVDEKSSFSAGTGVEFLGVAYNPAWLEYRLFLHDDAAGPFLFTRAGYNFYSGKDYRDSDPYSYDRSYSGGPSVNLGGGINWDRSSHDMYLSFSYRYFKTSYSIEDYLGHPTKYETNWHRLEIKLGFRF